MKKCAKHYFDIFFPSNIDLRPFDLKITSPFTRVTSNDVSVLSG